MDEQIKEVEMNQSDQFFDRFVALQLFRVYEPTDLEMKRNQSEAAGILWMSWCYVAAE